MSITSSDVPSSSVKPSSKTLSPSVAIIGIGGFGINKTRTVVNHIGDLLDDYQCLDTSSSNIRDGEKIDIVAGGSGSGRSREKNAEELENNIPQLSSLPDVDLYILIFSLSGGSGSIGGPLLMRELAQKGKRVIVATISDLSSEIDCKNTVGTIKTLVHMCKQEDIYLPVILADNMQGGRVVADTYIHNQIVNLVRLLKLPAIEVDRNDRLAWVDPSKVVGIGSGIRMMYIDSIQHSIQDLPELNDKNIVADSVLSLGSYEPSGVENHIASFSNKTRFRKDGHLAPNTGSAFLGIVLNYGVKLESIIEDAQKRRAFFKSQETESRLQVSVDKSTVRKSGVVFD